MMSRFEEEEDPILEDEDEETPEVDPDAEPAEEDEDDDEPRYVDYGSSYSEEDDE